MGEEPEFAAMPIDGLFLEYNSFIVPHTGPRLDDLADLVPCGVLIASNDPIPGLMNQTIPHCKALEKHYSKAQSVKLHFMRALLQFDHFSEADLLK